MEKMMESYKPFFLCEYCGEKVHAVNLTTIGNLAAGQLPLCGCPESQENWEQKFREALGPRPRPYRSNRKKRRGKTHDKK
jgi:hypothetical protein